MKDEFPQSPLFMVSYCIYLQLDFPPKFLHVHFSLFPFMTGWNSVLLFGKHFNRE